MYKSPMQKIDATQRGVHTTVLREASTVHSKKPECAYQLIESLYPNLSKIELFARNYRPGWVSWGNELQEHNGSIGA